MLEHVNQIHKVTTLILVLFVFALFVFSKFTSVAPHPLIVLIILSAIFIPAIISSALFAIVYVSGLIRNKNMYLIGCYSIFCLINYQISTVYTKDLIYGALGYNPQYLPHTMSLISTFVQLPIGLFLIANLTIVFCNAMFFLVMLIPPLVKLFPFYEKEKSKECRDKLFHIGFGATILAVSVILMYPLAGLINHKAIIRNITLMTDYYPVYQSTYICKEARSYELFNYLNKNMISVYKYDEYTNEHIFKTLNCATV
ncbi:TPA: hypothetical protein ACRUL4_001981 [Legionella pneumophila]|nr:hypothetical protein [Legionella pneumophila]HAT1883533.1 hypothetical protein [Legionella pneumophila]HAT2114826.1 hypothetical protein [Legionella pneumophila]HAT8721356.1 hypothetical protein [Legionella pneumophila]